MDTKFKKGNTGYWFGKKRKISDGVFLKGHVVSQEMREKMSIAKKGKPNNSSTKFKKGIAPWNKGKHTGIKPWFGKKRPEISKSNHYNWKGGITSSRIKLYFSKEYQEWRNNVFAKDDYTCQECGLRGGIINAHHIKRWSEYPKLRFDVDNGITLCLECHNKTKGVRKRKWYGCTNAATPTWEKFTST